MRYVKMAVPSLIIIGTLGLVVFLILQNKLRWIDGYLIFTLVVAGAVLTAFLNWQYDKKE